MTFQFTPWILAYLFSAIGTSAIGIYAWRRRHEHAAIAWVVIVCLGEALWALGESLVWMSADLESKLFWFQLGRLGSNAVGPSFLLFAATYTGLDRWVNRWTVAALFVFPLVNIALLWSTTWHHLIYTGFSLSDWNGVAALVARTGPLWSLSYFYGNGVALIAVGMIVMSLLRSPERYRGQMVALLIAAAAPIAAGFVQVLQPSPLNPVPIAVGVTVVASAWAIFRHGFLDMIPAARHAIIENMSDAVLVLDQSHRVVDLNPAARRLVTTSAATAVGQPIADLLPESARSLSAAIAGAELREAEVALAGRDYELRVSPVRNKDGAVTGRVLLLHDITEQKQTREALRQTDETSRTILESIEDGYYEIDLQGTFTRITEPTARLFDLPREEVIGKTMRELTDDATVDRLAVVYNQVRESPASRSSSTSTRSPTATARRDIWKPRRR